MMDIYQIAWETLNRRMMISREYLTGMNDLIEAMEDAANEERPGVLTVQNAVSETVRGDTCLPGDANDGTDRISLRVSREVSEPVVAAGGAGGDALDDRQPAEEGEDVEIWKPVIEGRYWISNFGNIKNKKGLLKPNPNASTLGVVLSVGNGIQRWRSVARMVADAFLDKPEGTVKLVYKDGNVKNCRADNLKWEVKE